MQNLKIHESSQVAGGWISLQCNCWCEDFYGVYSLGWADSRMACYEDCGNSFSRFWSCHYPDL